jgi:uncharacterized protein YpmB
VATPKKSWRNILTAEESAIADQLFEQVVDLKNAGGLTMCGTEVVSVFLKRRVQPLMSRPHQLWMYVGKDDKSRVSSVDLSDEELHDGVRRLTRFSQKDNIILTLARRPYGLKHLPAKVIFIALVLIVVLILSPSLFINFFNYLPTCFYCRSMLPSYTRKWGRTKG